MESGGSRKAELSASMRKQLAHISACEKSGETLKGYAERHGHDIGYRDIGYLLLVPHDKWDGHLKAVDLQRSLGAPVERSLGERVRRRTVEPDHGVRAARDAHLKVVLSICRRP